MGLTPEGLAVFRRRDVDIATNEDTMNRMGFGAATIGVQPAGQGVAATGVGVRAPAPTVAVLPPDTIEFTLDLKQGHVITMRDKTIKILDANSSGIHFVVR